LRRNETNGKTLRRADDAKWPQKQNSCGVEEVKMAGKAKRGKIVKKRIKQEGIRVAAGTAHKQAKQATGVIFGWEKLHWVMEWGERRA